MKPNPIPKTEQELFVKMVRQQPLLFDSNHLSKTYKKHSKKVISDPFSKKIVYKIKYSLKQEKPLSVIRMGDGEMNFLTFSKYSQLPKLSTFAATASVNKREHSFKVNEFWLFLLEEMMMTAVNEADIIGVLGLWRPGKLTSEKFVTNINNKVRGKWGQWTGLDYINKLIELDIFRGKIITSAHLYFSIIQNLKIIFKYVKKVYLITNQDLVLNKLSSKFKNNQFVLIDEPESPRPLTNISPKFLNKIISKLPQDMSKTLTLIGAGPWSEFYCTWIKRRGGVAIDIGSGFDLILKKNARPIHNKFNIIVDI